MNSHTLKIFLYLTMFVKMVYFFLYFARIYVQYNQPKHKTLLDQIDIWKKRAEFICIIMTSLLLIYLFNPMKDQMYMIDKEVKTLLFLNGFLLLFIAFENYDYFTIIQKSSNY
jgi:hypothetical protein